mmetsp:Transcript_96923/g.301735  ORF Transcript_96923/g.301735 Transcript_96923/m.301735 type:complete len:214 (-) Transcript_96923:1183-1824(-)
MNPSETGVRAWPWATGVHAGERASFAHVHAHAHAHAHTHACLQTHALCVESGSGLGTCPHPSRRWPRTARGPADRAYALRGMKGSLRTTASRCPEHAVSTVTMVPGLLHLTSNVAMAMWAPMAGEKQALVTKPMASPESAARTRHGLKRGPGPTSLVPSATNCKPRTWRRGAPSATRHCKASFPTKSAALSGEHHFGGRPSSSALCVLVMSEP